MALELDHVIVWTAAGAPEADRLAEFGLNEGSPNEHPGQGTACRRFFFANAYLELLWVHNPADAQSEATRETCLWERWRGREDGCCPFGFVYRPCQPHEAEVPFATWEYRPAYLPAPLSIGVGRNARALAEPMLFFLSFGGRPDRQPPARRQPLRHCGGFRELTRVEMVRPPAIGRSPELQAALDSGLIRHRPGTRYLVELGFDGETQGQRADFSPTLPLALCW